MNKKGLTLVEMLLVVSLMTFVTATVVATVAGGLKVWGRLQQTQDHAQWIVLTFSQMRNELRSMRKFNLIPFEGSYKSIQFAAPVHTKDDGSGVPYEMGRVRYYFDNSHKRLCRAEDAYIRLSKAKRRQCTTVIADLESVRFGFLKTTEDGDKRQWVGKWDSTELPLAIRCEVKRVDVEKKTRVKETLVVDIPLGSGYLVTADAT